MEPLFILTADHEIDMYCKVYKISSIIESSNISYLFRS